MAVCFVIQPFDHDKFDKRYDDVFVPAIKAADLEAYRVDRDPSVDNLLDAIERGIDGCTAFLADITLDNPNVWYELGYANAVGKPHCICCSEERTSKFPFDVSHLNITRYKVGSSSDFQDLERKITERLKAVVTREAKLVSIRSTVGSLTETEGLAPHEVVALTILFGYQFDDEPGLTAPSLQSSMEKAGFTKTGANLALTELLEKGHLTRGQGHDDFGSAYVLYSLTRSGIEWLRKNQDKLVLTRSGPSKPTSGLQLPEGEDIPF